MDQCSFRSSFFHHLFIPPRPTGLRNFKVRCFIPALSFATVFFHVRTHSTRFIFLAVIKLLETYQYSCPHSCISFLPNVTGQTTTCPVAKCVFMWEQNCYGEICNHHRNSLNKGPCHRSLDRETRRDTLDRTREELHSLCKYYNKLLYLFKHIVPIISFISFHGILSLDYPYIIATSGYIKNKCRQIYSQFKKK